MIDKLHKHHLYVGLARANPNEQQYFNKLDYLDVLTKNFVLGLPTNYSTSGKT